MPRRVLSLLLLLFVLPAAQAQDMEAQPSILEIAMDTPNFSTLVTAVQAAGLVDALSGDGPFTILAPTNDAFDALPEGVLEDLLADGDKLRTLLGYHVIEGESFSIDDLTTRADGLEQQLTMSGLLPLANGELGITIGQAGLVGAIEASNGSIVVIDRVITPRSLALGY
jgi:uncharacterized surface protein with fasciclin (FAS1) repeats